MKKLILGVALLAVFALALGAQGADVIKANSGTGTDLTAGASWDGSAAPTSSDIAIWGAASGGNSLGGALTIGSDVSWQGIIITNATAAITTSGAGILTLGSSGITMLDSGVDLTLGNSVTFGASSTINVGKGRTLTLSGGTTTFSSGTTTSLSGAGAMTFGGTQTITGSGALTVGSGFILRNNLQGGGSTGFSGSVTLNSGAFYYQTSTITALGTGTLTINGGTIGGGNGASGARTVSNATTLGGDFTIANEGTSASSSTFSGAMNLGGATRTITVSNMNGGTATISGVISNGGLTKAGSGTLAISTQATYTGGTTVNGGTLKLSSGGGASGVIRGTATVNSGAILDFATGDASGYNTGSGSLTTINLNGGTLNISSTSNQTLGGATISLTGGSITGVGSSNLDFFQGSSALSTSASATSSTISGVKLSIRQTAGLTFTVADGAAATDLSISSVIANNVSFTTAPLIKAGAGAMSLTGVNTYTGATTISAGTLEIGGAGQLGSGTYSATISNSGTLSYNSSATQTLSGVISGTGSLLKPGSGELTLSGNNTFSGGVNLSSGILRVNHNNALGTGTLSISNNATLAATNGGSATTLPNAISITDGKTLTLDAGYANITLNGNISVTGNTAATTLTKTSTGTLTLGGTVDLGTNANAALKNDTAANLVLAGTAAVTTPNVSMAGTDANNIITIQDSASLTTKYINLGAGSNASGRIVQTGGTVTLASGNTGTRMGHWSNGTNPASSYNLSGGTLDATGLSGNAAGAAQLVNIGWDGAATMTVGGGAGAATLKAYGIQLDANGDGGGNDTLTISANGVVEVGGGNLGGASTSDKVILNGGTLKASAASTWSAAMTANTSTTSVLDSNGFAVTLSGAIDGAGNVTKTGSNMLTLSGANTYSGATVVSGGTLKISNTARGTSGMTVNSGATLELGATNMLVGGHGVAVDNSRVLTANGGTLVMNTSMDARIGNVTLTNGGTWTSNRTLGAYDVLLADTTTGAATVTVSGSGAATMNGAASSGIHLQGVQKFDIADVTSNSNTDLTVSMILAGPGSAGGSAGGINKLGAGTMLLSGVNTFTGVVTVNAGIIKIGNAAGLGATDTAVTKVVVASGATVDFNGIADAPYGYTIAGTGVGGAGALVNTGLEIGTGKKQASNIKLSANASIGGTGNWALLASGYGATSLDLGGYTLTKTGSNTIWLCNSTATAGTIQISGGTLSQANANNTLTSVAVSLDNTAGANLALGDRAMTIGSLAGGGATGGNVDLGSYALTAGGLNTNTSYGGVISGSGSFTKAGTGTMTLSRANTYTGATTVSAGVLEVTANDTLGTNAAGTTVNSGAALKLNGVNYSTAEALTINGTGVSNGGSLVNAGTSTFAGAVTAATSSTINVGGGTLTFTGGLVKNGTTLTLTGGGTVNVNTTAISGSNANSDLVVDGTTANLGVANTYNGPTYIRNGGIINANAANALPTANGRTAVTMDDSGTGSSGLALGANQSISSLAGAASSTVSLGANQLTIGTSAGSTTFAGVISGSGASLVKDNASTLVLSGANTYTGATSVNAGVLSVTGSLNSGSTVTIANGATLSGSGSANGAVTVSSGGILTPGVSGSGTLTLGSLTLGASSGDASTINIGISGLPGSAITSSSLKVNGDVTANGGAGNATFAFGPTLANLANGTYTLIDYTGSLLSDITAFTWSGTKGARQDLEVVSGTQKVEFTVSATWPIWTGAGEDWSALTGNWKLNTDSTDTKFLANDTVHFDSSASSGTVNLTADVDPVSVAFEGDTLNYTLGSATGKKITSGLLTKAGNHTLTINNANSFSGGTTITGGTLVMGNNDALGTGSIALNGGTLDINGMTMANGIVLGGGALAGNGGTLNGAISETGGARSLTVGSSITLSGTNTYTGGTTLNAGTLTVTDASSLGNASGALTFAGNSTLKLNGTITSGRNYTINNGVTGTIDTNGNTLNHSGVISGSGALTKSSAGSLTLTGVNTYSGATTINAGTLEIGGSGQLGSGSYAGNIINAGTLKVNTTASQTLSGVISSTGALVKDNTGALTLTGVNTYSGATTISAGTLEIGSAGQLNGGSYSGNIANTGNLKINTSANQTLSGNISGTAGTLAKTGSGSLALSGTNSYTGGTTLSAGTLNINSATAIGTGAFTISGGTMDNTSGGSITLSNNNTQSWTGDFTFTGSNALNLGTGTVTLGSARQVTVSASTLTVGGVIGGAYALTKAGDGTLSLSGNNTYSGGTTVSGGTLAVTSTNSSTGAITVGSGTLTVAGNWDNQGSVTINNGGTLTITSGGLYRKSDGSDRYNGYVVTVNSGGTLNLASFVYNGNGGLGGNMDYGYARMLNGGTINITGSTQNAGQNFYVADGSSGTFNMITAGETLTLSGNGNSNIAIGGALTLGGAGNITISETITNNTGAGSIIKSGAGTLTLSGSNTFTGGTTLSTGQLNINNATALGGAAGAFTISGSTTIDNTSGGTITLSNNNAQNWNGDFTFTGSNALNLGTGAVTLSANRQVTVTASTLTVGGAISGGYSLTKAGGGTLLLNGSNGYTGGTSVNSGTLQVGNTGATNGKATLNGGSLTISNGVNYSIDSGLTFASNMNATVSAASGSATMYGWDVNSADIIVNNGVSASIASSVGLGTNQYGLRIDNTGDLAIAGVISGTGKAGGAVGSGTMIGTDSTALWKLGAGTLTLTGASTFTAGGANVAATSIQAGVLKLSGGDNRLPSGSAVYLGNTSNSSGKLALDGINQTITGLTTIGSGTGNAVVGASATLSTLTVNNTNNYTFGGKIGGAGDNENNIALTKSGNGALTLSAANTYTGATSVNAGLLEITSNNALGTNAAGTTVANGAALKLNGVNYTTAEALTINGTGSGSGALLNTGTSTFAGQVTAATHATINAGSGTLAFTGGLVKDGTTLTLTGGGTITVSGTGISGSSANSDLVVDGTTLTIGAVSTYNGPTSILNGGTLNANVTGALPTSPRSALTMDATGSGSSSLVLAADQEIASLTGASSSTVNLNGNQLTIGTTSGTNTFAGVISGTGGSLVKDGASTMVLSGANIYSGKTTVVAGVLEVTGSMASEVTATNAVTTVKGTGTFSGGLIMASGAKLSPGNSPGTITIDTGDLTLQSGSEFIAELNGTGTNEYDRVLFVNGSDLILDGATLSVTLGYAPTPYVSSYTVFSGYSSLGGTGTFASLPNNSTFKTSYGGNDYWMQITYGANDIVLSVIPEPGTAGIVATFLAAALLRIRRPKK